MPTYVKVADYEADRVFSSLREEHNLKLDETMTPEQLQLRLDQIFRTDTRLKNLGEEGRRLVYEEAFKQWGVVPGEVKSAHAMTLRLRGLISPEEYYLISESQGLSRQEAESNYRNFEGSDDSVFWLKEKRLLRYGEYSQILKAKGWSKSSAWRRWRVWEDEQDIRPLPKSLKKRYARKRTRQP